MKKFSLTNTALNGLLKSTPSEVVKICKDLLISVLDLTNSIDKDKYPNLMNNISKLWFYKSKTIIDYYLEYEFFNNFRVNGEYLIDDENKRNQISKLRTKILSKITTYSYPTTNDRSFETEITMFKPVLSLNAPVYLRYAFKGVCYFGVGDYYNSLYNSLNAKKCYDFEMTPSPHDGDILDFELSLSLGYENALNISNNLEERLAKDLLDLLTCEL